MGWASRFIHKVEDHHMAEPLIKREYAKNFAVFYESLLKKHLVKISFIAGDEVLERVCVPLDYGVFRKIPYEERYHLKTVGVEGGDYTLHVEPSKVKCIVTLDKIFEPKDYVKWGQPYSWRIPRDWEDYS